jgi:hypothetical protein
MIALNKWSHLPSKKANSHCGRAHRKENTGDMILPSKKANSHCGCAYQKEHAGNVIWQSLC